MAAPELDALPSYDKHHSLHFGPVRVSYDDVTFEDLKKESRTHTYVFWSQFSKVLLERSGN